MKIDPLQSVSLLNSRSSTKLSFCAIYEATVGNPALPARNGS